MLRRFLASFFRITSRAGFLAVALLLGLVLWYLPSLLNLDSFRPQLTDLLQNTFHCRVILGELAAQILPVPAVSVGPVVFLENSQAPRLLASVARVHVTLALKPLLRRHFEMDTVRFIRPRILVHRDLDAAGTSHWMMLRLPNTQGPAGSRGTIDQWQIRRGTLEIWDHSTTPTSKWVADQFSGSFLVASQKGAMTGKAAHLGPHALVDLHYDASHSYPLDARFNNVDLATLQPLIPTSILRPEGVADLFLKVRMDPSLKIGADIRQRAGLGHVSATVEPDARGRWYWSAQGQETTLQGTDFTVPEWSAKKDAQGLVVYAQGRTPVGGQAEVTWTQRADDSDPTLDVDVSSVTLREILDLFHRPRTAYGYESWILRQGSMRAAVHEETSFDVLESEVELNDLHGEMTGTFGLREPHPVAHLSGRLDRVDVPTLVEHFFPPPSPLTGTGQVTLDLTFPLEAEWIKGAVGTVQLEVTSGVLRALKTTYRIVSVLNLGNYLSLRFPRISAEGIEFDRLAGHLRLQGGVLSSEDLFLHSPEMNVGAKGSVDLVSKQVSTALRLEMFHFLEDILRDVPITHWIFKKPNKILLPLLVTLEGPWDNPEIH